MKALKKCATRRTHTNALLSAATSRSHQRRRQAGSPATDLPVPARHRATGGPADPAQTSLSPAPPPVHLAPGLPAAAPGRPQPAYYRRF